MVNKFLLVIFEVNIKWDIFSRFRSVFCKLTEKEFFNNVENKLNVENN